MFCYVTKSPYKPISFLIFFLYLSGASHSQINKSKELCKSVLQVQKMRENEAGQMEMELMKIKRKKRCFQQDDGETTHNCKRNKTILVKIIFFVVKFISVHF